MLTSSYAAAALTFTGLSSQAKCNTSKLNGVQFCVVTFRKSALIPQSLMGAKGGFFFFLLRGTWPAGMEAPRVAFVKFMKIVAQNEHPLFSSFPIGKSIPQLL